MRFIFTHVFIRFMESETNNNTRVTPRGSRKRIFSEISTERRRGPKPINLKRLDYISWDEYFMSLAHLSAARSKDPSSQVGSCIVDSNNRIVGIGYNGFPIGCSDDILPWSKEGPFTETKYAYVCHAEMNAIMNKNNFDLSGCTLYSTLAPCNECCKLIIQSGIKNIIYADDTYHDDEKWVAARRLLQLAGVRYSQYKKTGRKLEISM